MESTAKYFWPKWKFKLKDISCDLNQRGISSSRPTCPRNTRLKGIPLWAFSFSVLQCPYDHISQWNTDDDDDKVESKNSRFEFYGRNTERCWNWGRLTKKMLQSKTKYFPSSLKKSNLINPKTLIVKWSPIMINDYFLIGSFIFIVNYCSVSWQFFL